MADNVAITAGTGTSIATDDVSSVHFQKVKLDLGADGATDPVIGAIPTVGAVSAAETATWTSATAQDAAVTIDPQGYSTVTLTIVGSGTYSDGAVTLEGYDGVTWIADPAIRTTGSGGLTSNFALAATTTAYHWVVSAYTSMRVRLSTAIVGSGSSIVTLRASRGESPVIAGAVTATISGTPTALTQGTVGHDSTATSVSPLLIGGYSSSTAPTDVTANNEAVRAWYLRNGAQATVVTAAGALIGGDATNGLDVDVTRVTGTVTVDGSGVTQPVSLAALPALVAGTANIGDVDVLTVPAPLSTTGSGTEATALRVTLATDSTGLVSVDDNGSSLSIDDGGNTITVDGTVAVSGTVTVADSSTAASTMNASSSDGATALTSTAQAIKGSAGTLLGYYVYNPNATAQFVQFYNTASGSVTVGTTNPLFMITVPAGSAANLWMQPAGIAFSTAISWAATSTAGGNGAPTTALDAVAWYK
jgi:hypothetical protein